MDVKAVLAVVTMLAFFCYIGLVTFTPVSDFKSDFVNLALGWLGGTASTVIAYYFGSSAGQDAALKRGSDGPEAG
jgi:hypothetical protein